METLSLKLLLILSVIWKKIKTIIDFYNSYSNLYTLR